MEPWREVVPPGPIYADKLNALAAEVARLSKLLGDGIDVEHGPANVTLTVPRPRERHVVKVYADEDSPADGCTTQAYRWVRQTPAACGVEGDETPTPVTGGVSTNNPAYLPNGGTIPDGTVVEIVPGAAYLDGGGNVVQEWIILQGGGGTANVKKGPHHQLACKDDPSKTTCNGTGPSPHCYYPGKLQTLTCAGWDNGERVGGVHAGEPADADCRPSAAARRRRWSSSARGSKPVRRGSATPRTTWAAPPSTRTTASRGPSGGATSTPPSWPSGAARRWAARSGGVLMPWTLTQCAKCCINMGCGDPPTGTDGRGGRDGQLPRGREQRPVGHGHERPATCEDYCAGSPPLRLHLLVDH
jgi:hypothetical protein